MKTNLRLELDALKVLREEYRLAVEDKKSLFILMEIKLRLDTIKELCLEDMFGLVG